MPDALSKIDVAVTTLAKPVSATLLAARTAIRITPFFQELFQQARAEAWGSDRLADALCTALPEYLLDPQDLAQTCQYLADEFVQMGEHTLLISQHTGLAIARLTSDDIYVPPMVARETGDLAHPLPRLRPELEGLVVQWQFDRAQDRKVVQALAQRLPSSELLAHEGDPRLLRATLDGRRKIVAQLKEDLPGLLHGASGVGGEFINLCKFSAVHDVPEGYLACAPRVGFARVNSLIVDPLTLNMRQDPFTALRSQIGQQWVRDIAQALSGLAHGVAQGQEASVLDSLPSGFWIADPNTAMALRGKRVLPVQLPVGASTTLIHTWLEVPALFVVVPPESFACRGREFLGRWEVAASFEYTLYLNPDAFSVYYLKDVSESGISVEVVS